MSESEDIKKQKDVSDKMSKRYVENVAISFKH